MAELLLKKATQIENDSGTIPVMYSYHGSTLPSNLQDLPNISYPNCLYFLRDKWEEIDYEWRNIGENHFAWSD